MSNIDWYSQKEVTELNEKYNQKYRAIIGRKIKARENQDEAGTKKAYEDLAKHRKQGETYEEKAEESGCCWN